MDFCAFSRLRKVADAKKDKLFFYFDQNCAENFIPNTQQKMKVVAFLFNKVTMPSEKQND